MKIVLKNRYFEEVGLKVLESVMKIKFTANTSYWLAKIYDKIKTEAKYYFDAKNRCADECALRYEEDGEEREGDKVIRTWKKGDIVLDGRMVVFADQERFNKEVETLMDIEIDLEIRKFKIILKDEPNITPKNMRILLPFIENIAA